MEEKVLLEAYKLALEYIKRADEKSKRDSDDKRIIVISFCIVLIMVSYFYFKQDYPEFTQSQVQTGITTNNTSTVNNK